MSRQEVIAPAPNQGWDPRILVCQYNLPHEGLHLPMQVFIVVTERYVVLIDTLINAEAARGLLDLAAPHLAGRQLLVINTHADYDHAWGNQLFAGRRASHPAPLISSQRCAERLRAAESAQLLHKLQQQDPARFADVELSPADIRFARSLTIDGGDLTLQLLATPGHTDDHCSIFIPELGTLLAADAAELPFPFIDGALTDMRTSLAELLALDAQIVLYCHAPPQAGRQVLERNLAYFETLEQRCRAALARGAPAQPGAEIDVEALVGFSFTEAIPPGHTVEFPDFYRPGHEHAIRAMLAALAEQA